MTSWYVAIFVLICAASAEILHARRIARAGRLIFSRGAKISPVGRWAPWCRVAAYSAFAWSCVILLQVDPQPRQTLERSTLKADPASFKRIVILLDVSPSMWIEDASGGKKSRLQRAGNVVSDALLRVASEQARVSLVAFYTDVKPVVIDAVDTDLIHHLLTEMTLVSAFEDGTTDLLAGLQGVFDLAKDWRPGSATLIVVTDGDSVSQRTMPEKPSSISNVLVVGVGDSSSAGTYIDGHYSRQETSVLSDIATRLSGAYCNVNQGDLPNIAVKDMAGTLPMHGGRQVSMRWVALVVIAVSCVLIMAVSPLLACFGVRRKGVLLALFMRRHSAVHNQEAACA